VALETFLPAAMRLYHAGHLSLPQLFRAMALNPANGWACRRAGWPKGAPADLVLFDPDAPFQMDRFTLRSKSKNTPFDGARMEGRVLATWVGGNQVFARR
jgi:dihydroorotase